MQEIQIQFNQQGLLKTERKMQTLEKMYI